MPVSEGGLKFTVGVRIICNENSLFRFVREIDIVLTKNYFVMH
jgi:hypothetical protein